MIAELEELVVDRNKGDLSKYRITQHLLKSPANAKRLSEALGIYDPRISAKKTSSVMFLALSIVPTKSGVP
jgi:hypothetical protein